MIKKRYKMEEKSWIELDEQCRIIAIGGQCKAKRLKRNGGSYPN